MKKLFDEMIEAFDNGNMEEVNKLLDEILKG